MMTAAFEQSIAVHRDTLFFSFIEERIKSIGIHHRMKVCYRFDKPKKKKKKKRKKKKKKKKKETKKKEERRNEQKSLQSRGKNF